MCKAESAALQLELEKACQRWNELEQEVDRLGEENQQVQGLAVELAAQNTHLSDGGRSVRAEAGGANQAAA